MWNVLEITLTTIIVQNKQSEGWTDHFKNVIITKHPRIGKLIEKCSEKLQLTVKLTLNEVISNPNKKTKNK